MRSPKTCLVGKTASSKRFSIRLQKNFGTSTRSATIPRIRMTGNTTRLTSALDMVITCAHAAGTWPAKRKRDSAQPQDAKRERDSAKPQEKALRRRLSNNRRSIVRTKPSDLEALLRKLGD